MPDNSTLWVAAGVCALILARYVHLPATKGRAGNVRIGKVSVGFGEPEAPSANQFGHHFHPSPAGTCIRVYQPEGSLGIHAKVNMGSLNGNMRGDVQIG
jgi:hypothetical protein